MHKENALHRSPLWVGNAAPRWVSGEVPLAAPEGRGAKWLYLRVKPLRTNCRTKLDELAALGCLEVEVIEQVHGSEVVDGCVVRMPRAYPLYDEEGRHSDA